MRPRSFTIAAVLLLGLSNAVSAQSFECKKAQTRVEKMICADARMSAQAIATSYKDANLRRMEVIVVHQLE